MHRTSSYLLFSVQLCFSFFLILSYNLHGQTKVSNSSGNWNNAGIWTPFGVPSSSDDVLIQGTNVVDLTSNQACKSLTVGNGSAAQLRYNSGLLGLGGVRQLTVNASIVVKNSASIIVYSGVNTHSLIVGGDITNSGTIDFRGAASVIPLSNSKVDVYFIKNGNQNISGAGILTRFNQMNLNMGASSNNILNVFPTSFAVATDFLRITNGTFKYSVTSAINITPFTAIQTIPTSGGFWMNSSASTATFGAGVNLSGVITVSTGTLNVGDASDENLLYSSGSVSVAAGVLNIAGRYAGVAAANTCNFNLTGGAVNVPVFGSTNTTDSPFQISTAGSQFNMSAGNILIQAEGGSGAQNLGYVNLAGSGSVSGGTLQIGSSTSPANQIMKINSTVSVPNLLINNSTSTGSMITNAMNVLNNITINSGILNSNNLNITLGGNWTNNGGTYTPGTSLVTFNSVFFSKHF